MKEGIENLLFVGKYAFFHRVQREKFARYSGGD